VRFKFCSEVLYCIPYLPYTPTGGLASKGVARVREQAKARRSVDSFPNMVVMFWGRSDGSGEGLCNGICPKTEASKMRCGVM